jgi:wyosine [tRNA(Phe)-imidazoG37] synthetase (radical SAM superfamily)
MDIIELLNEIKRQTLEILGSNFKELKPELQKDITAFLENSKQKLERWTLLVTDGSITTEELEWLLKSEQDLITLQALQTAGLTKIKLNNIKKTIIKTVFQVIITTII